MKIHHSILFVVGIATVLGTACGRDVNEICSYPNACTDDGGSSSGSDAQPDAPPAGCASGKDPKDDALCVTNDTGVFVDGAAAEGGDGTKERPLKTLAKAVEKAQAGKGVVFVCGQGPYLEAVNATGRVSLFGGFTCGTGTHAGGKSEVAPAVGPALVAGKGATFLAQDLKWTAEAAQGDGASSIAVFAKEAALVELVRNDVVAGAGATGKGGDGGSEGKAGTMGNVPAGMTRGTGGVTDCGGGVTSTGGNGGDGNTIMAQGGALGSSVPGNYDEAIAAFSGAGGKGFGDPMPGDPAQPGRNGKNGAAGAAAGAAATSYGTLASTGFTSSAGTAGAAGNVGQGGGGGGGGASQGGGGGGGGGCGGTGGKGGEGGGASIAIASLSSTVRLKASKLSTAAPGSGGIGGIGGTGGAGGVLGNGNAGSGSGGDGGNGAGGNGGGGGTGGVSVGVLYTGSPPTIEGASVPNAPNAEYHVGPTVADNGGEGGGAGPMGTRPGHPGNTGKPGDKGKSGVRAAVLKAD